MPGDDGLRRLEARIATDLALLRYPERPWLRARYASDGSPILDVLIVGGGQGGLTTAFALMRERLSNILVVDENPEDFAGPWLTFARMRTLRTPKHLTGPDLGIPSLTPRAFYEARHGEGSWDRLASMPRQTWAEYLNWYRDVLKIPFLADTRVGALRWRARDAAWEVPCSGPGTPPLLLLARRVVLATGIDGSGAWTVPSMVRDAVPPAQYAHTRSDIDFAALAGRRVAVLGAGASAFDNAATALEHGAREVRLFFRRQALVNVNPYRWAEFVGFLHHLGDLPDADRWRFILQIVRMGQLPPKDTYERARAHAGFHLHPGSPWRAVAMRGGVIAITTDAGEFEADFVIVGTGFVTDLALRPELAHLEASIARWADRFVPPPADRHEDLLRHPYLGPHFEFTERVPGSAPELRFLFNYTFGSLASLGFGGANISGMKYSIPRLVRGVTGSLFAEDRDDHFASLQAFAEEEF